MVSGCGIYGRHYEEQSISAPLPLTSMSESPSAPVIDSSVLLESSSSLRPNSCLNLPVLLSAFTAVLSLVSSRSSMTSSLSRSSSASSFSVLAVAGPLLFLFVVCCVRVAVRFSTLTTGSMLLESTWHPPLQTNQARYPSCTRKYGQGNPDQITNDFTRETIFTFSTTCLVLCDLRKIDCRHIFDSQRFPWFACG